MNGKGRESPDFEASVLATDREDSTGANSRAEASDNEAETSKAVNKATETAAV